MLKEALSAPALTEIEKRVAGYFTQHADLTSVEVCQSAEESVDRLRALYQEHTQDLHDAFMEGGDPEHILTHQRGTYPYLGIYIANLAPDILDSHGVASKVGYYGTTITHPQLFSAYLLDQLTALTRNHEAILIVGQSRRPIPISFLKDNILHQIKDFSQLHSLLVLPSLNDINDAIVNGLMDWEDLPIKPLSLFPAERVDYSLGRLKHYCGTSIPHFQNFILMTNYQRYVDGFFHYAQTVGEEQGYTSWVDPQDEEIPLSQLADSYQRDIGHGFQMPAYHLKRPDNSGITLINIGVGPSNTKTITDHLAVLRSHCWLILGHCGGLHHSQKLGDYVLANGYMRDDRVLDEDLPLNIPIPPIAEVQQLLSRVIRETIPMNDHDNRRSIRSGTVVSTGNRNWELRVRELSRMLNLSRAIAVDMESATLAANAFRFCIPYGALLCVSDRPLHGELKMHGPARTFYQQRVQQHLHIGIKTMESFRMLEEMSPHSRKLRGFQAVPFR